MGRRERQGRREKINENECENSSNNNVRMVLDQPDRRLVVSKGWISHKDENSF